MNKAKNNVADFNSVNFSDLKLKVSSTFLNTSDQTGLKDMTGVFI